MGQSNRNYKIIVMVGIFATLVFVATIIVVVYSLMNMPDKTSVKEVKKEKLQTVEKKEVKKEVKKEEDPYKKELEKYGRDWKEQFVNFREAHNEDLNKLLIDESVLYIYVKNISDDMDLYCKMYAVQFQKAYHENTKGNNVGVLVYYRNRLIKEYDVNNDGIK